MEFKSPFSRIEAILQNILGADNVLEDPLSRAEVILLAILNDTEITEEFNYDELSELEALLYAIKESDEEYDAIPQTRSGKILLKILHGEKYEGETASRVEELLKEWSHAAAWYTKTVGPSNPINVTDALAEPAIGLKVDLSPIQASTPWIDTVADTKPYLLRPTETTGNTADEKLVGGSVVWNQIIGDPNFTGSWWLTSANTTATYSNNIAEVTVNEGATSNYFLQKNNVSFYKNHKYFISYDAKADSNGSTSTGGMFTFATGYSAAFTFNHALTDNWARYSTIVNSSIDVTGYLRIGFKNPDISGQFKYYLRTAVLTDLTQMFANNPAIADYIYLLEQASAGSGIAWLKSYGFFTKDYYPYNPGEIMSVKTSAKKVAGLNKEQTYTLGNDELRGLFKLDTTTNKLYTEGDTKTSDGEIDRKYSAPLDLGSLVWNKYDDSRPFFFATVSNIKRVSGFSDIGNIICSKYATITYGNAYGMKKNGVAQYTGQSRIAIYDSTYAESDTATFKAAMSGTYLICELETATSETSTLFTNPQDIYAGGTEEFVDERTVPIPAGHETIYSNVQEIIGYDGIIITHGTDESDPNPTEYQVLFQSIGTVYSGSLDVLRGVLTVDMAEVDLGTLEWQTEENSSLFYATLSGMKFGVISTIFSGICTKYPSTLSYSNNTSALNNMPNKTISNRTGTTRRLYIKDSSYTDAATFKAAMSGAQLVYELATPLTYNLTPIEVEMLLNNNYLKSDGGVMTLTYKGTNPAILLMNKLRTKALMRKTKEIKNGNLQPILPNTKQL